MWTEQEKLSRESGEFIHSIAMKLKDNEIEISGLTEVNQKALLEISESLRKQNVKLTDTPILISHGFDVLSQPRPNWVNLACYLINEPKKPLKELVEFIKKWPC